MAWVLTFPRNPWSDEQVTDFPLYREFAGQMFEGRLPYRDFAFEYPPLAALASAALLTFVEFPGHYFQVVAMEPAWLWLLGARDLLLVAAVGIAIVSLLRGPAAGPARSSPRARPRLIRSARR